MTEYKDAEAIKAQIREVCRDCWTIQRVGGCVMHCGINDAIKAVDAVPAADVAPVVPGQWTADGNCDVCGVHALFWSMSSGYSASKFCPNCGAKMKNGR